MKPEIGVAETVMACDVNGSVVLVNRWLTVTVLVGDAPSVKSWTDCVMEPLLEL